MRKFQGDGLERPREAARQIRIAKYRADVQFPTRDARYAAEPAHGSRTGGVMSSAKAHRWPEFAGKVVVVTGGSAGIGRCVAETFARQGARIAIAGRDFGAAERVAEGIARDFAGDALAVQTDISVPADCSALIQTAVEGFGGVDILVNNAAFFALTPLIDVGPADAARMLDTNFRGPLFAGQALARWTIANRRTSVIVNVSSISGARPAPGCGLYSASKAALDSLTKSMALEWTPLGIRVNGVAPGHVDTEGVRADFDAGRLDHDRMTAAIPARRIADVSDVANAVLFLSSDRSRHFVGETLTIDGGEAL
jgi:NAD(P)-dependent dehydrogenase (short-subunit alcohol dehydrogenase family)